jgi:hypothetical protein
MGWSKEELSAKIKTNDHLGIEKSSVVSLNASPVATQRFFTLLVDHLPDSKLSLNARLHWTAKRERTADAKEEIYYLAKERMANWKAPERAVISYTYFVTTYRPRDLDNLISSCKAWQDGLVEVGVLRADDCWHLSFGRIQVLKANRDQTKIVIEGV